MNTETIATTNPTLFEICVAVYENWIDTLCRDPVDSDLATLVTEAIPDLPKNSTEFNECWNHLRAHHRKMSKIDRLVATYTNALEHARCLEDLPKIEDYLDLIDPELRADALEDLNTAYLFHCAATKHKNHPQRSDQEPQKDNGHRRRHSHPAAAEGKLATMNHLR